MIVLDCDQLLQHSILARILTTQQLNDLDFEQIVSLHSHLSQCFDNDPRLRFVYKKMQHYCLCIFMRYNDVFRHAVIRQFVDVICLLAEF